MREVDGWMGGGGVSEGVGGVREGEELMGEAVGEVGGGGRSG